MISASESDCHAVGTRLRNTQRGSPNPRLSSPSGPTLRLAGLFGAHNRAELFNTLDFCQRDEVEGRQFVCFHSVLIQLSTSRRLAIRSRNVERACQKSSFFVSRSDTLTIL